MATPKRGFTLIELLVAVAIVGILAAIAYPSYSQYIVRSNRSAAESHLLSLANKQEQYMLDHRQYTAVVNDLLPAPGDVARNYTVTIAVDNAATPPAYTITATPTGSQAARDTRCAKLMLDQNNQKSVSGAGTDCW